MVNQIVLVGRIAKAPETKTSENGRKFATLTLAVPRNYKNANGEYDTDFLDCTLWSSVAESTSEYCKTGDMIGVKGRVQSRIVESPDGLRRRKTGFFQDMQVIDLQCLSRLRIMRRKSFLNFVRA